MLATAMNCSVPPTGAGTPLIERPIGRVTTNNSRTDPVGLVPLASLTPLASLPLASLALLRNALLAVLPNHFGEKSLQQIHEDLHSKPAACLRVIRSK